MSEIKNKVVMVTGGGANIGREIALRFAEKGAAVVVLDYNAENAERTVKEIEDMGGKAMAAPCDVRDRERIFAYVRQAEARFGTVDVLVNNAGGSAGLLGKLTRFVDAEVETLDFVLDTNIKGAMHCTQAVLPSMIAKKYGKIIHMSSIAAVVGLADRVDYSAAKAALIGMAKALAQEVGQYNICVNCVSPGAIHRVGCAPFEHMTQLGETGHGGMPSDIADAVLFLSEQDYITGENLVVDGGRTLGVSHR